MAAEYFIGFREPMTAVRSCSVSLNDFSRQMSSPRHSRPDNVLLDYTDFAVDCRCWFFFFFLSLSSPNYDLIYVNNSVTTHVLKYLYVPKICDRRHGQYARGVFDCVRLNRYLEMSIVFRFHYKYYYCIYV